MRPYPRTKTRYVRVGFKGLSGARSAELTDPAYATSATNFAFEDGCLTGYIGLDRAPNADWSGYLPAAPLPILNIFHYRFTTEDGKADDRLVARLSDHKIWYIKLFGKDEWHKINSLQIEGDEVQAINYNHDGRDCLLFCSKDSPLFVLDDVNPLYSATAPRFSCFEMHSERLFGGVNGARTRLWFSDDYDPINWNVSADEAGYITFDDGYGDILQAKSFLGYLYIFREYAIFRLTAFGKQSEFSLRRVFIDSERILKASIACTGASIMFMAGTSLFEFDGYNVRRIAKNLPKLVENCAAVGTYLNGYYWLAAQQYKSSEHNDTVLRYELKSEQISVMEVEQVENLICVKTDGYEVVLASFGDEKNGQQVGYMSKNGYIMGSSSPKRYEYAQSTLGTMKLKTVRCFSVVTSSEITVTIVVDGKKYSYDLNMSRLAQRVNVGVVGRSIGVEITTLSPNMIISPLTLEIEVHAD